MVASDSEINLGNCLEDGNQFFMVTVEGLVRRHIRCLDGNRLNKTIIQYVCNGYPHQNWLYRNEVSHFGRMFFVVFPNILLFHRPKKFEMVGNGICVSERVKI